MLKHFDLSARLLANASREAPIRPFDVRGITGTIHRALAAAGLNTQSGALKGVTDTIEQALSAAGLRGAAAAPTPHGVTIDAVASEIQISPDEADGTSDDPSLPPEQSRSGVFASRSFTNHAGTRSYKLYVPASYLSGTTERVPMVVMLHGCTQSPDDFAAGTRMNALAEEHGFLVLYPAQAPGANGSKCWNWFRSEDQNRDGGEPALIAGLTRAVAASYRVDERRIFVAGLSAGAAMAVILGATYPDLYAAVGAHSGLPYGAAHDMPSAFGAMQGGTPLAGMPNLRTAAVVRPAGAQATVPTIVFHGDSDHTVHARNGAAIVEQATGSRTDQPSLRVEVHRGAAAGGRAYTRTVYNDAAGQPVAEQWVLHGAGHAWSGGSERGSFTDVCGPDASAEMIRFFCAQPHAGAA